MFYFITLWKLVTWLGDMLKIQGISPDTLGSIKCLNDSLKRLWKMRKEHFGPTSAAPFRSNGVKDDRQQEKPSYVVQ